MSSFFYNVENIKSTEAQDIINKGVFDAFHFQRSVDMFYMLIDVKISAKVEHPKDSIISYGDSYVHGRPFCRYLKILK